MVNISQTRDAENPDVGDVRPENYLGWSKAVQQPAAGQGTEALLKGIGTGFADVTKVANFAVEHTAIDEAMARGTAERDAYVSDLTAARNTLTGHPTNAVAAPGETLISGGNAQAAPPAVQNLGNQVGTLGSARANNKISETDYKMRVDTLLKDLRSRYPGYRPQIDQTMEHATGVAGANSLVSSLVQDVNSFLAKKDQEKDQALAILHRPEVFGIPNAAELSARIYAGDRTAMHETMVQANRIYAIKYGHELAMNRIHEIKGNLELAQTQSESEIMTNSNNHGATGITNLIMGGGDSRRIDDVARAFERGEIDLTPEQKTLMASKVQEHKSQMIAMATRDAFKPGPNGEASAASIVANPEKVKAAIGMAGAWHDHVLSLIGSKDVSAMGRTATLAELQNTQMIATLTGDPKNGPGLRLMQAGKALGSDFITDIGRSMINNKEARAAAEIIATKAAVQAAMPLGMPGDPKKTGRAYTFNDAVKEAQNAGIADPTVYEGFVQMIEKIADPNTNEKVRSNLAKAAFHPEMIKFLDNFERDSSYNPITKEKATPGKYSIYKRMLSQDMIDTVYSKGGEDWANMKDWYQQSFRVLLNEELGVLRSTVGNSDVGVKWDSENNRLMAIPKYSSYSQTATQGYTRTREETQMEQAKTRRDVEQAAAKAQESFNRLNTAMEGASRMVKKDDINGNPSVFLLGQLAGYKIRVQDISNTDQNIIAAILKAHDEEAAVKARMSKKYEVK